MLFGCSREETKNLVKADKKNPGRCFGVGDCCRPESPCGVGEVLLTYCFLKIQISQKGPLHQTWGLRRWSHMWSTLQEFPSWALWKWVVLLNYGLHNWMWNQCLLSPVYWFNDVLFQGVTLVVSGAVVNQKVYISVRWSEQWKIVNSGLFADFTNF